MRVKLLLLIFLTMHSVAAQNDSIQPAQDAVYSRPFIAGTSEGLAIGGYVEGNTNYLSEDGVTEGFSMEMRRVNLFLYASLHERLRFLSEIEFEHGTEEIAIETAQLDFILHPALVFRAGILLVPIGSYNINHDSPRHDFVDRPLVTTQIIPSTMSEVGFGFNGKLFSGPLKLSYDAYAVNGLSDQIIFNNEGRTLLEAGKSESAFEEDNNGFPSFTGRLSVGQKRWGEVGLSGYHGPYNTYKFEGEKVDQKRWVSIRAVDFSSSVGKFDVKGEAAWVHVDVPDNSLDIYGENQWGGYVDFSWSAYRGTIAGFEDAKLKFNLRLESIDYHTGTFKETGRRVFDEIKAIGVGASLRLTPDSVIKLNYFYRWVRDHVGNPATRIAGFQVGVASYF